MPIAETLLGIGGLAANIAEPIINYQIQKNLIEKQNAYNMQQYEKQRQDNLDLWRLQQEYNSPEKQMERLKNAGINPIMAYSTANTTAPPIQGGTAPTTEKPNVEISFGKMIENFTSLLYNKELIEKAKNENEILKKQAEKLDLENTIMFPKQLESLIENTNLTRQQKENLKKQYDILTLDEIQKKFQNTITRETIDEQIMNIKAISKNNEEIAKINEIEKRYKEIEKIQNLKQQRFQTKKIIEEINSIKANTENTELRNELIELEKKLNEQEIELRGYDVEFQRWINNNIGNPVGSKYGADLIMNLLGILSRKK